MIAYSMSLDLDTGGNSQALAISGSSAASTPIAGGCAVITPTVNCFVRRGTGTPVAVADGTDLFLAAGFSYRVDFPVGQRIAAITSGGAGILYITPAA